MDLYVIWFYGASCYIWELSPHCVLSSDFSSISSDCQWSQVNGCFIDKNMVHTQTEILSLLRRSLSLKSPSISHDPSILRFTNTSSDHKFVSCTGLQTTTAKWSSWKRFKLCKKYMQLLPFIASISVLSRSRSWEPMVGVCTSSSWSAKLSMLSLVVLEVCIGDSIILELSVNDNMR